MGGLLGGVGAKGMLAPSQIIGGAGPRATPPPPVPTPMKHEVCPNYILLIKEMTSDTGVRGNES